MMLFGLWQLTATVSAQQSLTLAKILTGLQTKGNTPETSTLAARNVYITKRVQNFGVTFRLTSEFEQELRNAGATTALINAIRDNGPAEPTTPTTPTTGKPTAAFKNLWVDYGVTESGQLGMRIHTKFTTYKMKNMPAFLAIYFQDQDGEYLKDTNDAFNSSDGLVAVYQELTPGYDPADFNDLSVFMPYSELDLAPGNYNLKMEVKLIYKQGGIIQELTTEAFSYKKPKAPVRPTGSVTAKVTRIWVDYNVTEGGVRGMRIHVNFEVSGLKGIGSQLTARVMKENGTFLTSSKSAYSNSDGHLAVSFPMNPGYPKTVYEDADVFLPYGEIVIGKGKWNLKIDVDLNYEDGELIQHLDTYPFEFERP
jgi:hypothetical protein